MITEELKSMLNDYVACQVVLIDYALRREQWN